MGLGFSGSEKQAVIGLLHSLPSEQELEKVILQEQERRSS
jgi:hypothetical protein